MTIQNTLLLIAGLVNLAMSIIVLARGTKNKVNVYFSLLTFFNFLWAMGLLLARESEDPNMIWYYCGALLVYPLAIGIAVSLFYFSLNFPIRVKTPKLISHILLIFFSVLISILVYVPGFFVSGYVKGASEYSLFPVRGPYILYSLLFVLIISLAIYNLAHKYRKLDVLFKKQTRFLLITIVIGLVFGSYFDLVLCYNANYRYAWLGPLFTLPMNFTAFYLIYLFKNKE